VDIFSIGLLGRKYAAPILDMQLDQFNVQTLTIVVDVRLKNPREVVDRKTVFGTRNDRLLGVK
jgi:hypothetical protein